MRKKHLKKSFAKQTCFVFSVLVLLGLFSFGQTVKLKSTLLQIKAVSDSSIRGYPAEKLYLQFDKPNYAVGDTIWYKCYLFNAPTLGLSSKSGIINMDVIDEKGTLIKQYRQSVKQGLGHGNIGLSDIAPGAYLLRCYTNWMRNFGDGCFFYKQFIVAGETAGNLHISTGEHISSTKKQLVSAKSKAQENKNEIDLQFLPEGGSLISGKSAHVGFKAVDVNGQGINVTGVILDNENQQIASFSSLYKGMGSFDMPVKPGAKYTARVNLPNGLTKQYALPAIKNSGTSLQVNSLIDKDSVVLSVNATKDIAQLNESYFLIGKARNVVCYAAVLNFSHEGEIKKKIAKSLFPSGITHFVLMNNKQQSLNERLIFINDVDNLVIDLNTNKTNYHINDSIGLRITVTDKDKNPVAGNFSIAITDNALVSNNLLKDNIITHILLSSELKGTLEEPGYYIANNAESNKALDNLLLTQGWVNYEWPANQNLPVYAAEDGFAVNGKVLSGLQKPLKGVNVSLLSKWPLIAKDTVTDTEGHFTFKDFPRIDKPFFVLQAVNRHGKSFNVGIKMDDPEPPALNRHFSINAEDVFADTALALTAKNNRLRNEQSYLAPNGHLLKEVTIKAQKVVKGSQNLNGPGNADLVLDEADLEKAGKKSWLQILTEKVKGFREGTYVGRSADDIKLWSFLHSDADVPDKFIVNGTLTASWYFINDKPVKLLVDGTAISDVNYKMNFTDLENYLKFHNAEDIKGIEVMSSSKFGAKYTPGLFNAFNISYIEITSRTGNGPVIESTPGVYLYKPLPLSVPSDFYKPRYMAKILDKNHADTRSTIDWEPNVEIDKEGKSNISFYAAGSKSTYTVIVEGTDGNGNLAFKRMEIKIN